MVLMGTYLHLITKFFSVPNVKCGFWINLPHLNYTNRMNIEKNIAGGNALMTPLFIGGIFFFEDILRLFLLSKESPLFIFVSDSILGYL